MRSRSTLAIAALLLALAATSPMVAAVPDHAPEPASAHAAGIHPGTICGWFANPTPQDFLLLTASADWLIGEQGGFQAGGDWGVPHFRRGQWVHTHGGSYGYGCACLRGTLDAATRQVLQVKRINARSLRACRKDPALRARESAVS